MSGDHYINWALIFCLLYTQTWRGKPWIISLIVSHISLTNNTNEQLCVFLKSSNDSLIEKTFCVSLNLLFWIDSKFPGCFLWPVHPWTWTMLLWFHRQKWHTGDIYRSNPFSMITYDPLSGRTHTRPSGPVPCWSTIVSFEWDPVLRISKEYPAKLRKSHVDRTRPQSSVCATHVMLTGKV